MTGRAGRHRVPLVPRIRAMRMLWRMLPHLAVAAVAAAAVLLLGAPEVLRRQVLGAGLFVVGYSILRALTAEILSPLRPALRLVPLDDRAALRIQGALRALWLVLLVTELGAWLVRENDWIPSVASFLEMTRNAALLVFVTAGVVGSGFVGRFSRVAGEGVLGFMVRFATKAILPLAVVVGLFQVVARGLGYVPLADWVLEKALVTVAQLLVVALAHRLARRVLRRTLTLGGAKVHEAGEPPSPAAIGAERIAGGFLRLLFVAVGGLWVLSTWSLGPSSLAGVLDEPVLPGGGLHWGTVAGGAARVALVLLVSWFLRNLLTFFVFPRARLDVGARYAVLAMLRYTVVILVVFFTLSALGVETSSLAWFLGAAGVGLGLGLQDVLGNFFSGLLMLVERPIRIGDFVLVGDAAGTVEAIRMRGTVIRTPENVTVLVPNRQMIGERVTNLTYGTDYRRLQVQVGVAYDSDPEQVRQILLAIARRHPLVRREPAPFVQLSSFGDSSLDFTLFAQSGSPLEVYQVASDIRFQVLAEFRRAGVEIPFPQRDMRIREWTPSPTRGTPPAPRR